MVLADGFGLDFVSFGGHSYWNARVLPADRAEEHLWASRAGLCHGRLLAEVYRSEVAECGASVMEFYQKNVLLSAFIILLQHAGKSFLFRADWCLQGGCFYGWLTDGIFVLFLNCRFESSSHAISMSAYLREQRRELYSRSGELQGGEIDNVLLWIILFCTSFNILCVPR